MHEVIKLSECYRIAQNFDGGKVQQNLTNVGFMKL